MKVFAICAIGIAIAIVTCICGSFVLRSIYTVFMDKFNLPELPNWLFFAISWFMD